MAAPVGTGIGTTVVPSVPVGTTDVAPVMDGTGTTTVVSPAVRVILPGIVNGRPVVVPAVFGTGMTVSEAGRTVVNEATADVRSDSG